MPEGPLLDLAVDGFGAAHALGELLLVLGGEVLELVELGLELVALGLEAVGGLELLEGGLGDVAALLDLLGEGFDALADAGVGLLLLAALLAGLGGEVGEVGAAGFDDLLDLAFKCVQGLLFVLFVGHGEFFFLGWHFRDNGLERDFGDRRSFSPLPLARGASFTSLTAISPTSASPISALPSTTATASSFSVAALLLAVLLVAALSVFVISSFASVAVFAIFAVVIAVIAASSSLAFASLFFVRAVADLLVGGVSGLLRFFRVGLRLRVSFGFHLCLDGGFRYKIQGYCYKF